MTLITLPHLPQHNFFMLCNKRYIIWTSKYETHNMGCRLLYTCLIFFLLCLTYHRQQHLICHCHPFTTTWVATYHEPPKQAPILPSTHHHLVSITHSPPPIATICQHPPIVPPLTPPKKRGIRERMGKKEVREEDNDEIWEKKIWMRREEIRKEKNVFLGLKATLKLIKVSNKCFESKVEDVW